MWYCDGHFVDTVQRHGRMEAGWMELGNVARVVRWEYGSRCWSWSLAVSDVGGWGGRGWYRRNRVLCGARWGLDGGYYMWFGICRYGSQERGSEVGYCA